MRKLGVKTAILLAVASVIVVGLLGAYSYGRDYYLHRGFAALVPLPRAGTGQLLAVNYYSTALHRRADYMVYLPPGYSPRHRYPVYYLLHGMPGQPKVFVDIANMDVRLDNQLALGHVRPMILVYPDGRIGGSVFSDSEWANTPSGNYESYVLEVMHNVDQRFSTLPRRQDRVIAGFSAGAYGALNIALHHLSAFANVQSWSGYFTQTRAGVFAAADPATLAYNSPEDRVAQLGRTLTRYPLRIHLFAGRSDPASRQQPVMVNRLSARGARVQARLYPGGHDWSVWYPRLNQMLDLASSDFACPVIVGQSRRVARGLPPGQGAVAVTSAQTPRAAIALSTSSARLRRPASELRLLGALLLALISGALINLGFVLQQRGHSRALARGQPSLIDGFRDRSWLIGQGVGWLGFAGAIIAVGLAPLTLVQAFSAGSLALSVPLAARLIGQSVSREQLAAIGIIAIGLVSLPIGFTASHGQLHAGVLIAAATLAMAGAAVLGPVAGSVTHAIAAGILYGAGDAAIKADAVALRVHGMGALPSGWTVVAGLCTFGGFLCFQAALRGGDAVRPIALMTAFTALTAAGLGVVAFGEPFGTTVPASVAHGVAIVLVLACVWPLARAQQRLIVPGSTVGSAGRGAEPARATEAPRSELGRWPKPASAAVLVHASRVAAAVVLAFLAVGVCSLVALGLLYSLRGLQPLAIGPSVPDVLPLLQLAGVDAQPLVATVAASLAAGAVLGLALRRASRSVRLVSVAILGPLLLLLASDASFALARNLRLGDVLLNRAPGMGPWVEGLLLAAGSAAVRRRPGVELVRVMPGLRGGLRLHPRLAVGAGWAARRRLVLVPLAAAVAAVAAASITSFVLPNDHARAQARTTRAPRAPLRARPSRPASGRALARASATRRATHPTGRLLTVTFYSEALRRQAHYLVYLPSDYTPARPLPVFYLLHGMPGRPLAFTVNASIETRLEKLIARNVVQPMILVFPDGRIGERTQTDSEWANTPAGRFESYVVNVVHNVDQRFATLPSRGDRAIAGLSAGAYGAVNVGLHQVALFGLVQAWSGYFTQTRTGVFSHATRAQLVHNSPSDYVRTLRPELARYPLQAFLYVGNGETDRGETPAMAAALRAAGADAHHAIYSGGHNWNLWTAHLDQMLIMAARFFAPQSCPSPSCSA